MTRTKLEEAAWGLIANVSDGKWNQQPDQWQRAAELWRDEYHETADQTKMDKPCSCNTCNEIRTGPSSKLERTFGRELLQHTADVLIQESEWWDDTAMRSKTDEKIALFCKGIWCGYRQSAKWLNEQAGKLE